MEFTEEELADIVIYLSSAEMMFISLLESKDKVLRNGAQENINKISALLIRFQQELEKLHDNGEIEKINDIVYPEK